MNVEKLIEEYQKLEDREKIKFRIKFNRLIEEEDKQREEEIKAIKKQLKDIGFSDIIY